MSKYDTGLHGELQAEHYLTEQCGMRCITRRYRGGEGEVDLIMEDQSTLVFVEVKARPRGAAGDGLMAVTPAKIRRLRDAAMHYLVAANSLDRQVRFDVIEITRAGLRHIRNAF